MFLTRPRRTHVCPIVLVTLLTQISVSRAQETPVPEARELVLGTAVEREIAAGKTHTHTVTIPAGHFAHASVQQKGADVAVAILSSGGETVAEIDSPTGSDGTESVSHVADAEGTFRFEVRYAEGSEPATGKYAIVLDELRPATQRDRSRVAGERTSVAALHSWFEGSEDGKRQAIAGYSEALAHFRAAGERRGEADTLSNLAAIHTELGDRQKALGILREELPIRRDLNDAYGLATIHNNLGEIILPSDARAAMAEFERGVPYARAAGNATLETNMLLKLAKGELALGKKREALERLERAMPRFADIADRVVEIEALMLVGEAYSDLGFERRALEYFDRALPLVSALGDKAALAGLHVSIGSSHYALDEKQAAIEHLEKGLQLARGAGNKALTARILYSLALTYGSLGDRENALARGREALSVVRASDNKAEVGRTLHALGWIHLYRGTGTVDLRRALSYFRQALPIRRAVGDRALEAFTLTNIGDTYERLGQRALGRRFLERALAMHRASGSRRTEAHTLTLLGGSYAAARQHRRALALFDESLPISRAIGDRSGEATTLYRKARAERDLGRLDEAKTDVEAALDVVENLRGKLESQELRAYYLASVFPYYELYIDVLMRLHRRSPSQGFDGMALRAAERARARGLVELLAEAGARIRRGVDPTLLERLEAAKEALDAKAEEQIRVLSAPHSRERGAEIVREVGDLEAEYEKVRAEIRARSPRYAALTQPEPLGPAEIQRDVLDDDTVLLEYALGEERSYAWVVTKTSVRSFELPPRERIEGVARRFHMLVSTRRRGAARDLGLEMDASATGRERLRALRADPAGAAVRALGAMIVNPVARELKGRRILVVADGALQYVPFGALPVAGGHLLLETYEVVHAPSATTIAVLRREREDRPAASGTLAILADPVFEATDERLAAAKEAARPVADVSLDLAVRDLGLGVRINRLKHTRTEAESILALVPPASSRPALDFAASHATATGGELGQYRLVHFATHGLLDTENPSLSGLVLSLYDEQGAPQRGFLRMHEVFDLELGADLVVLSACQTGLGKQIRGEGLIGLTRGFMYAGSPRVVVSLWNVNDAATAELMSRFYQAMVRDGKSAAAALRSAQLEMMRSERRSAPYYWAPFVVQGDWR